MRILLVGNPNVGKSVVFSRLTGARVIASNYSGTTVEITKGFMDIAGRKAEVVDAPGIYSLEPVTKAEQVAVELIDSADMLVNIIDATNLERNLYLTLELLRTTDTPMIVVLNVWDETKHKGIEIDCEKLASHLNVPVVATCGLTGEGIKKLVDALHTAENRPQDTRKDSLWCEIGTIIQEVQKLHHRHHTFFDVLEEASVKPPFSFFIAAVVVFVSFLIVRFVGESLISYIFDPFFNNLYNPFMVKLGNMLGEGTILHSFLIGNMIEGKIDYAQSFGFLTTGIYVPLAMVFPYVVSFYFILGMLEDSGYLPRLAIVCDRLFHKIGLHGFAIVPTILGLGCNVPGALSSRLFEARKERFIVATLLAIAVPCMAQSAMIIALLGRFGGHYVALVFFILIMLWFVLGSMMKMIVRGRSPEILLEIPPYRMPHLRIIFKKLWLRVSWFFKEAVPLVLIGMVVINILYLLKIVDFFGTLLYPVVTKLLGLPQETVGALIIGFLRKDVAVGMLRPLNLTVKQAIVGSTVLAIYFPCVATFVVLLKELGIKDMLKSIGIMLITVVLVGSGLNFVLTLFGMQ